LPKRAGAQDGFAVIDKRRECENLFFLVVASVAQLVEQLTLKRQWVPKITFRWLSSKFHFTQCFQ
jgi:hypothetical protein